MRQCVKKTTSMFELPDMSYRKDGSGLGLPGDCEIGGLDKFYTKPDVVADCLKSLGDLSEFDCVIEPSAGAGAFYEQIAHANKIALDIMPQHSKVKQQDWLDYCVDSRYDKVAIVGNPPFGKYNRLSSAFIKHAVGFPNVTRVAFVLPDVYNKHTRQSILPADWRMKSIWKLPDHAFIHNGASRHVPCSFYVFCRSKGRDLRAPAVMPPVKDFSFATKHEYDIFVFGASPKKIVRRAKPNNRGHFLKSHIEVARLAGNIRGIEWRGNSCANGGVYWLTQYEFALHYYERYGE